MKKADIIISVIGIAWGLSSLAHAEVADWMIGPFTRPKDAMPIIRPDAESVFSCPMRQKQVFWKITHTFNPSSVVKDGKVYIVYRAEDNIGGGIGGYTSRLGLAWSDDGIRFTCGQTPVLYPDIDDQRDSEWEGGCEDPRLVETEDGMYVLFYTQYRRKNGAGRRTALGSASSKDLIHWVKNGTVQGLDASGKMVTPSKSASLVTAVQGGKVVAKKIDGKYWLYYGEGTIRLLTSPDLKTWTPVAGFGIPSRSGKFDSGLVECGPPALCTAKGIVLLYNGKNSTKDNRDPDLSPGVYTCGQLLFDANEPAKLLARSEKPFFQPEKDWEKSGQYVEGTTFIEGLTLFHGKWFLYYGCADTFVGVATADAKASEITIR